MTACENRKQTRALKRIYFSTDCYHCQRIECQSKDYENRCKLNIQKLQPLLNGFKTNFAVVYI